MKIYLCGQKTFGAETLKMILKKGHEVVGVSAPLEGSAGGLDRLRAAAQNERIPVMPSGMLNAETLPVGIDVIVAAHSHDFIGKKTRHKARLGAIGYHPSMLPRHRGRDAVRWAIKMGDAITGGSVYWLTDSVDAGPVAAHDWCFIPPDADASRLWRDQLLPMGVRLLGKVLDDLSRGLVVAVPQDEALATWEPGWERPPVRRPDLLLLTDGRSMIGVDVVTDFEDLWERHGRIG